MLWHHIVFNLDRLSVPVEILFSATAQISLSLLCLSCFPSERKCIIPLSLPKIPSLFVALISFCLGYLFFLSCLSPGKLHFHEDRTLGLCVPKFALGFGHCWCSRSILKTSVFYLKNYQGTHYLGYIHWYMYITKLLPQKELLMPETLSKWIKPEYMEQ